MNKKLPTRPRVDEFINVAVTAEIKKKAFEAAANEGLSVSHFVRRAILQATEQLAA